MPKLTNDQKTLIQNACEKYAFPGGYPLYSLTADGGILCPDCVASNLREVIWAVSHPRADQQWEIVASDANYENPDLTCEHCGKTIECAYCD